MKNTAIRIDAETLKKIRIDAKTAGRTMTGQIKIAYAEWRTGQQPAGQRPDEIDVLEI